MFAIANILFYLYTNLLLRTMFIQKQTCFCILIEKLIKNQITTAAEELIMEALHQMNSDTSKNEYIRMKLAPQ